MTKKKQKEQEERSYQHYLMLYRAYYHLTIVEQLCLEWPGELSESEITELARFKNSFATGINNHNRNLSIIKQVKATRALKKEFDKYRQ